MHPIDEPVARTANRPVMKRWMIVSGIALCAASWTAFGIGWSIGLAAGPCMALLTVALLITEGLFWLVARLLGISAYQRRRTLVGALLRRGLRHAS